MSSPAITLPFSRSSPYPLAPPSPMQHGCTPLLVVCAEGHTEIAELLLRHGAKPGNIPEEVRSVRQSCTYISKHTHTHTYTHTRTEHWWLPSGCMHAFHV